MIRLENISKSYGDKVVLNDLNAQFESGKIYGVVGENGAGKTTLFKCLAGLENCEGLIHSDLTPLKNHIGLLPTHPHMISRITGWEYLKLHCIARDLSTENFEAQNIFQLPLGQYADTYSTGMTKKLALMAILLQKNEVLILDEPFNGVDIHSNMIITELLQKLKTLNKTIIISSHIFSTLSDTCDEILLLKDGAFHKEVSKEKFTELEEEMKAQILKTEIDKIILE